MENASTVAQVSKQRDNRVTLNKWKSFLCYVHLNQNTDYIRLKFFGIPVNQNRKSENFRKSSNGPTNCEDSSDFDDTWTKSITSTGSIFSIKISNEGNERKLL